MDPSVGATPYIQLPVTVVQPKASDPVNKVDQKIKQLIVPDTFYKTVKDNEKTIKNLTSKIKNLDKELGAERKNMNKARIRKEIAGVQLLLHRALQDRTKMSQSLAKVNPHEYSKEGKSLILKAQKEISKGNESIINRAQKRLNDLDHSPFWRKKQFGSNDLDKIAELMQEVESLEKVLVHLDPRVTAKLNNHKMKLGAAFVIALGGRPLDKNLDKFIGDQLHRRLRQQERGNFSGDLDRNKILPLRYAMGYLNHKLREEPQNLKKLQPLEQRLLRLEKGLEQVTKESDETQQADLKNLESLLSKLRKAEEDTPILNDSELKTLLKIKHGSNNPVVKEKVKLCELAIRERSLVRDRYEKIESYGIQEVKRQWALDYLQAEASIFLTDAWRGQPYLADTLYKELLEIKNEHPSFKNNADDFLSELRSTTKRNGEPKYK